MSPTIEELKWANRMYLGGHKEMKELCVRFNMSHNQMRDAWDELGLTSYRWLKKGSRLASKEHKSKTSPVKIKPIGRAKPITPEERESVVHMRRMGHTHDYIAKVLNRSYSVVCRIWVEHLKKETRG
jgi:hypothetical protein